MFLFFNEYTWIINLPWYYVLDPSTTLYKLKLPWKILEFFKVPFVTSLLFLFLCASGKLQLLANRRTWNILINPLYQTKIFLVLLFAIFWFGLSWGVFSCLVGGAEGIGTIFGWGLYPLCLTWKLLKENEKLRWKQKQKQWVSGVYSVCCWSDRAFIYFSCLIGQHIYLWSNRELCHMRHAIARTNLCTSLNPFVTLSFAHLQQTWTSQGEYSFASIEGMQMYLH